MKPYSEDLRVRIVKVVQDGMPEFAVARLFGVIRNPLKECPIADRVIGADGPLMILSGAAVFSHPSSVTRK